MASEKTPVVWDDDAKKHRPLGSGEKMGGLSASSMISSDSGNLLQQGSDGLMLVTGGSIADPRADNLLEESANGKLQVTIDRVVEWLDGHPQDAAALADAVNVVSGDEGNLIVQGTDKGAFLSNAELAAAFAGLSDAEKAAIAAAVAEKMAAQLADGTTIVASGDKLHSDPTNATVAQKKAINQALADADSGLVVDNSTGKLKVDFSNMPTDKFEELLKGLKMLVPLSANKNLYVSTNNSAASDVLDDGRGTAAKPFKTIQACVNYATTNYAVGRYRITVRVVAGTYNENVTLPDFSRGTGYIEIVPDSGARDVIVVAQPNSRGSTGWCFNCSGGVWNLRRMDARRTETPTTDKAMALGCYQCSGSGELHLYGFSATQRMPSSPSPLGGENYTARVVNADNGGTIHIHHDALDSLISTQKPASGTPYVHAVNVSRGGTLVLRGGYDADDGTTPDIACSGTCDTFLRMFAVGVVNGLGGGTMMNFTGSVTGKQYELTGGSYVSASSLNVPGTANTGTIETSTYCWGLPDNG